MLAFLSNLMEMSCRDGDVQTVEGPEELTVTGSAVALGGSD